MNDATVALLDQKGQPSGVVQVGVRQQDRIEFPHVKARGNVILVGMVPKSLEQSKIH